MAKKKPRVDPLKGDMQEEMKSMVLWKDDGTVLHAGEYVPKDVVEETTQPQAPNGDAAPDPDDVSGEILGIATGENYDPNWRPTPKE